MSAKLIVPGAFALLCCVTFSGCTLVDSLVDKGVDKGMEKMFEPREISAAELENLVDRAWIDLNQRTAANQDAFEAPVLAIATTRMETRNVRVPANIQSDIQQTLEDRATRDSRYQVRSSAWLLQTLRRAGARDIEGLFEPDKAEALRDYLRQGDAVVRYVLVPKFTATHYEQSGEFKYNLQYALIAIDDGATDFGSAALTL